MNRTKGQKLLHGIIHNWLDETGDLPTHDEVFTHIFSMCNEEFDNFLNQQDYFFRKEMNEEAQRQLKLLEDKKQQQQKKKRQNNDIIFGDRS